MALLLASALVLTSVSLGWSIAINDGQDTLVYALHTVFALYTFLIAARSITQNTAEYHSESILHLTVLLSFAAAFLAWTAILPGTPPPVTTTSINDEQFLKSLWYTLTVIYIAVTILAYSTPLGPPLHYSPSDIYSEKTVASITNTDQENVCGIISRLFCSLESQIS